MKKPSPQLDRITLYVLKLGTLFTALKLVFPGFPWPF